jgi:hypothetical protein
MNRSLPWLPVLVLASALAQAATFTFRSNDGAGEGFNDPTPFTPIGGNNATTLGQARMNVMIEAGRIWGALIQSNVPIVVDVEFNALTCSSTSGTLGSAGARSIYRNVPGMPPDIYYVSALADALAGRNLSSQATAADISATLNSAVDNDSGCLGGRGFYYGFDHNRGTRFNLLLVMLHELGHGLGMTTDVDLDNGEGIVGGDNVERFSSYTHQIFDEQLGRTWPQLTASERLESATRTGAVAWDGAQTNAQRNRFASGFTAAGRIRLNAPATISSGSSITHWDPIVSPSALMEPNLPTSITTSSTDITICALQDIGWRVNQCPHFAGNRAPVASGQTIETAEDTAVSILLTGTDADSDALTYSIASPPTRGTLSNIDPVTHRVTYTPNSNANGSDSFSFIVNDGVASSTAATNTINVTSVNDTPTASNISISAQAAQATGITLLGSDIDGDALVYSIVDTPRSGTVSGSGANMSYRSNDGFSGTDTFTYRVSDGTLNSVVATVTLSVTAPASAPSGSGGEGGGALDNLCVILLGLAYLRVARR